jgi:hypothetical protein
LPAGAADGLEHPAGQVAVPGLQPVGLGQVEADGVAHAVDEREKAPRHQGRDRAARPHGLRQRPRPRHQADALAIDLVEHRDRKPGEQSDARLEGGAKVELAVHGAPRDRRHFGLDPEHVGQLVDALDRDHGRVHVADQQSLDPIRRRDRADVDRAAVDCGPGALGQGRHLSARDRKLAGFVLRQPARPGAEQPLDLGHQRAIERRPLGVGDQTDDMGHGCAPGPIGPVARVSFTWPG